MDETKEQENMCVVCEGKTNLYDERDSFDIWSADEYQVIQSETECCLHSWCDKCLYKTFITRYCYK